MKDLFKQCQREIVGLANNPFGRRFLEIPKEFRDKRVVKVTPNYFMVDTGRTKKVNGVWKMVVRSHSRCYPLYAKKLGAALSCLEILNSAKAYMNLNRYAGLVNYALNLKDNRYPQILLTQANYFAGAGDGNIISTDATYSTARDAATGDTAQPTIAGDTGWGAITGFNVYRGFFPTDTSGIADNETSIDAVVFNVWIESEGTTAHSVDIIQTTQPDTATLTTADFDALTLDSPAVGATRTASTAYAAGAYAQITFNGTGRAWISVSGFSTIGTREGTYDVDNASPPDTQTFTNVSFSETADTNQDPFFDITSTVPESTGQGYSIIL